MAVPAGYEEFVEDGVTYLFKRVGTQGASRGERWLECAACGECFPRSETVSLQGRTFGVPCGCAAYKRRDLTKAASAPLPPLIR